MKKLVNTSKAPAAIGPYSQAIISGNIVYCSGQIPLDPKSMELVGDTVSAQTLQVLVNLNEVLLEAGATVDSIIRTTVFLSDMANFSEFNGVYEKFLLENSKNSIEFVAPARATVAVRELPKSVMVEISCIAEIN